MRATGNSDRAFLTTWLETSLVWAVNYAHWLVLTRHGDIQMFLVDSRMIPGDRIYPAPFLAAFLEVALLKTHWHDEPYHEYFALGGALDNAVVGSVGVNRQSLTGREINPLLPGFIQDYPSEGLHASLDRFMTTHQNTIFRNTVRPADVIGVDIWAAYRLAEKFLNPTANPANGDILFQITMMFLSLRKRNWSTNVWAKLLRAFQGMLPYG